MQIYLAFLILKCAVILPALGTGNILELAETGQQCSSY